MGRVDAASLLALVRYHAWANDRILTTTAGLSDEEFRRPDVLDHGSAFQQVRHLVDVDWSWRQFCTGNDIGDTYVWDHGFDLDDLASIHAFSLEEDAQLRGYVESLDQQSLNEQLRVSPTFAAPRWLILAHVVNHGTQHRSELARYLTVCGHSPGGLELVDVLELPWPEAKPPA